jgi:hypothetical protein
MRPVRVSILHPAATRRAGPLERWLADARAHLADRHVDGFRAAGAAEVEVVSGPPGEPFGQRLRELLESVTRSGGGLAVLGSGAIPLATAADVRAFVKTAGADDRVALTNNRYSADIVAIARTDLLPIVPDLPGDNALPRWLEEVAGYRVGDLPRRARLGFDIDGPLELALLGVTEGAPENLAAVRDQIALVRAVAADRRAELVVAGRTSASTLRWLERHTAARVRAWVEERGMRAASPLAQERPPSGRPGSARPPASLLGALLERDGPGSLGVHLARFGDAALIDTRVLLAHRLGVEERRWPRAEDRFASDVLLPTCVADPWLRELTEAAVTTPIPVLLGGHSLVGPGVPLVIGGPPRGIRWT